MTYILHTLKKDFDKCIILGDAEKLCGKMIRCGGFEVS